MGSLLARVELKVLITLDRRRNSPNLKEMIREASSEISPGLGIASSERGDKREKKGESTPGIRKVLYGVLCRNI
jgi:hypothetical protein